MRARWIVLFVLIAAVHFSAAAATHLYVSSRCREASPGCQGALTTAGVLSLPLLPVARQLTAGTMGWRRAFVLLSANSLLVSAVLTGAIWRVAWGRARRAPRVSS